MATRTQLLTVPSEADLDATITSYIAQGFVISHRTTTSVVLFKKKEFSVLWAVIGLFLCALPLLVYLIVYATQGDEMIQIHVEEPAIRLSPDRQYWWDSAGGEWRDAETSVPPIAPRSPDGHYWWDGTTWRPLRAPERPDRTAQAEPKPLDRPAVDPLVSETTKDEASGSSSLGQTPQSRDLAS